MRLSTTMAMSSIEIPDIFPKLGWPSARLSWPSAILDSMISHLLTEIGILVDNTKITQMYTVLHKLKEGMA
jgi:hypothetical protein